MASTTTSYTGAKGNNVSTILGAGSTRSDIRDLTQSTNNSVDQTDDNKTSSNALEASKPISTGEFNDQRAGQYIMMMAQTHLAGEANTNLRSPGNDERAGANKFAGDNALGYELDFYAKPVWISATSGLFVKPSGSLDGLVGANVDQEFTTVNGEFSYRDGSATPVSADYPARKG